MDPKIAAFERELVLHLWNSPGFGINLGAKSDELQLLKTKVLTRYILDVRQTTEAEHSNLISTLLNIYRGSLTVRLRCITLYLICSGGNCARDFLTYTEACKWLVYNLYNKKRGWLLYNLLQSNEEFVRSNFAKLLKVCLSVLDEHEQPLYENFWKDYNAGTYGNN